MATIKTYPNNELLLLSKKVRILVSQNKSREALQKLNVFLEGHELHSTIILRLAQQNGLRNNIINGTISMDYQQLNQNQINNALLTLIDELIIEAAKNTTVYICYHQEDEKTFQIIPIVKKSLKEKHFQVFCESDIPPGASIKSTIFNKIQHCDYFIPIVTDNFIKSKKLIQQVELAVKQQYTTQKPIIIPIFTQISSDCTLPPNLENIFKSIQQLHWENDHSTTKCVDSISEVLYQKKELILPLEPDFHIIEKIHLESPTGAVRLNSPFYIERSSEFAFIQNIERPGALLRIRGPQQYGKTSLLTRVNNYSKQLDYHTLVIDFQKWDLNLLNNLEDFLYEFCFLFADKFNQEAALEKRWARSRPKKWSTDAFLERDVLPRLKKPILVAIDEADRLFSFPEVSKEFFLLLRAWHEACNLDDSEVWQKFRLALTYSTTARLAIKDMNASPFNVGNESRLTPFTKVNVQDLSILHGLNWSKEQSQEIMEWFGGQPYLVRQAMYLIANGSYKYEDLIRDAPNQDGPFGAHLRNHLANILKVPKAAEALNDILENGYCHDPIMSAKLEATGLVKGAMTEFEMSNKLYKTFFQGKL